MQTRPSHSRERPRPQAAADRRIGHSRRSPWLWERVESRLLLAPLGQGGDSPLNEFSVTANPAAITRPISGSTPILNEFTVSVGNPTGETQISVDYNITPINATAGVDYQLGVPASGTLTFGLDGPFFDDNFPVTVLGSDQDGGPHQLQITLSNPSEGASISPTNGSATLAINDAVQPGSLQFSLSNYTVPTTVGTAEITVTRTGGTAAGVSVHYDASGGTAEPNVDYIPTMGTLNFGAGVASQSFPITINPDLLLTEPKTINLVLSNPHTAGLEGPPGVGATLGEPSTAVVTIEPVNPLIVTNTNDSGLGSLREAILAANAFPGANTITFEIPGAGPHVISPPSALPIITGPTDIDARTEPGYISSPVVVLDGTNAGAEVNGLDFQGGSSQLYDLTVDHFGGSGVVLASSGNTVQFDRIGTDATGSTAAGNGYDGVYVFQGSGNTITDDLIAGNGNVGIDLVGPGASNETVQGNLIGTDASGTLALPNAQGGVFLNGASSSLIGGPGSARNVISGNGGPGVVLNGAGATGNIIQNNFIGTVASGNAPLGNSGDGVFLDNAPSNTIKGNTISANGLTGVRLMGAGASGNRILGNFIGTDSTGAAPLGNAFDGIFLSGSPNNAVGDGTASGRNVISANGQSGLQIFGSTASGNQVFGNLIGTDATGTAALGNRLDGVYINVAPGNMIGSTATGAGNVISANVQVGVQVFGPASTGNAIEGNLIGTTLTGSPVLGNAFGIFLNQAPDNVITPNTINGNTAMNIVKSTGKGRGGAAVLLATTPDITGASITGVVLTFSAPLNARQAENLNNYSFRTELAGGKVGPRVAIASASYDAGSQTVTLTLASPVPVSGFYRVTIRGGPNGGLKSASGQYIDGDLNGLAGGTSISYLRNGTGSVAPGTAKAGPR